MVRRAWHVVAYWLVWIGSGVAWIGAGAAPAHADVIERLLASVAGQLIMASDVAAAKQLGFVPGSTDQEVLDRLIDRALVLAEVDRYAPPEPPREAVAEAERRVRARFADEREYAAALATLGIDEGIVRERIRQNLRIDAYLAQRFVVAPPSDEEIEAAWIEERDRFAREGAYSLAEARPLVVRAIVEARRAPRVAEWIEALRRRARITRPGEPASAAVSE